jgi:hypothetical protein
VIYKEKFVLMTDLNIEPEPLDDQARQEMATAQASQASSAPTQPQPEAGGENYIEELQQLAGLRDSGIISTEVFEAKKQQLLGS